MARYERAMELITLIRMLSDVRVGKTAKEIAKKMNWHIRKTQNVLKMLKYHMTVSSEFDFVCGKNKLGLPTYLIESDNVPDVSFSIDELSHLEKLVENAQERQLGGVNAARDLITKIRSCYSNILSPSFTNETETLLRATGNATRPGIREHINQYHYKMMSDAIKRGEILEITKRGSEPSSICPLGFLHGINVYLIYIYISQIGGNHKSYIMRISQIENITETDDTFDRAAINFDLAEYASKSFGVYNDGHPISVIWEFDKYVAEQVLEFQFHPGQQEEKLENGNIQIRFSACSDVEMFYELFKWGKHVEIIEPIWFAEKYQAFLRLEQDRWDHVNHFSSQSGK